MRSGGYFSRRHQRRRQYSNTLRAEVESLARDPNYEDLTLHQFHQQHNNAEGGVFDDIISNINKVIEGVRSSAVGSNNAKVDPTAANYQVQNDQPRMTLSDHQPLSTTTERIVPPPAQESDDVAVTTTSGRRVRA